MCNKTWIKPFIAFFNVFPASVVDGCGSGSTCLYLQTIGTRWFLLKYLRKLPKKGLNSKRKNVGPTSGGLGWISMSFLKEKQWWSSQYGDVIILLKLMGFHCFLKNFTFQSKSVVWCCNKNPRDHVTTLFYLELLSYIIWRSFIHSFQLRFLEKPMVFQTEIYVWVHLYICKYIHKPLGAAKGVVKGCHFSKKTVWKVLLLELVKG